LWAAARIVLRGLLVGRRLLIGWWVALITLTGGWRLLARLAPTLTARRRLLRAGLPSRGRLSALLLSGRWLLLHALIAGLLLHALTCGRLLAAALAHGALTATLAADVDAKRGDRLAVDPASGLQALLPLEGDQGLLGLVAKPAIRHADVEALLDQHLLHLPDLHLTQAQ